MENHFTETTYHFNESKGFWCHERHCMSKGHLEYEDKLTVDAEEHLLEVFREEMRIFYELTGIDWGWDLHTLKFS